MTELKFPNESPEYRKARDALLEDEKALIAQMKRIAEKRRQLPLGGQLKRDYVFTGANDENLRQKMPLSTLFEQHETLLLYSYMFGTDWDNPCPSCTSLVDGFDRVAASVRHDAAFAVVTKASAAKLNGWAQSRGWQAMPLLSAADNDYLRDYAGEDNDGKLWPVMNVFTRRDGVIYHFYATEMLGNSLDTVWAYWNLMDLTPEGRPERPFPPQSFRSRYLEKHYLDGNEQ